MKFPFAIIVSTQLFASATLHAEPQILWEASVNTCNPQGTSFFSGCKPVTAADGITVVPEKPSTTTVDIIKDLSFNTIITYNSQCVGSSSGYLAKLTYLTAENLLAFNSPAGIIEIATDYSEENVLTFTRQSEKSAAVRTGCRISVVGNDTFPKSKSLSILDRYVSSLIRSGTELQKAINQLANLSNVNAARDAVAGAVNRLITILEQNQVKIGQLTEDFEGESDEFRKDAIQQEIDALNSLVTEDQDRITSLTKARDDLSVKCETNTEECTNVINEAKKTLEASINETSTELKNILAWIESETTRLNEKAQSLEAKIAASKSVLTALKTKLGSSELTKPTATPTSPIEGGEPAPEPVE